jgi:uncharacterized protein
MNIYEILAGKLYPIELNEAETFYLEDTSHLLIEYITNQYICITNTFQNKSFLIKKHNWHNIGMYPAGLKDYVGYPKEPLTDIECTEEAISLYGKTATFIIALSYRCNLNCKYCYQQCNESLDKSSISSDNLSYILNTISQFHRLHPDKLINIGLFGGEPLLPENYNNIIKIFDYCVENQFSVSITTNGVNLPYYLKDLVIYSGLNIMVGTTIDSITENEITRFSAGETEDSSGLSLLKSVLTLINNGVKVAVEMNIDKHNIDEIGTMINFYKENGFLDNPLFNLGIGLVDDRRYETGYADTVSETDLLEKLAECEPLHESIYYAFVKAPLNLCKKLYPDFRQSEMKYVSNYCWAAAPLDYVFYIDAALDVFRCSFSVGRKECSLFKFSLEELENYKLPNHTYLERERCQKCNIGGSCSGGCRLSADVDFDRMCTEEKAEFNSFLSKIYYPKIKSMVKSLSEC